MALKTRQPRATVGDVELRRNVGNADVRKGAARIDRFPFVSHFQGSPSTWVIRYHKGTLVKSGPGLSFWFRRLNTAVAEVPMDDQELPFLFTGRSLDFQDVNIQGVITYRVLNAEVAASRIDFTLDLDEGTHRSEPRVKIESFLTQMAQEAVVTYLSVTDLDTLISSGVAKPRELISDALLNDPTVTQIGLSIVNVSVASLRPRADVEKALQVPTFEQLQERADQATFERRAKAVEKEQTIQENEIKSKLALAKQQETLIAQEGLNGKRRMREQMEAEAIAALAKADQMKVTTEAEADKVRVTGDARAAAEKALLDIFQGLDVELVQALAFRTLAANMRNLSSLTIAPDVLAQLTKVAVNGHTPTA